MSHDDFLVEICPETGICSIIHGDKGKIDLMPDEVDDIRGADGNVEKIAAVLTESDAGFVSGLTTEDMTYIAYRLR